MKTKEVKEVYNDSHHLQSNLKTEISANDIGLVENDVLVIRGCQLFIYEYGIGFSFLNTMRVVKVNNDSFVIKVARGNIEINNKYKKYFYLADGVKLFTHTKNLNYRKRFESLS